MRIFRLLLTLCGMLFAGVGLAGEISGMRFMHIGLEDGLSHSTIFGINQDKEGNLWFATYDGLNKYDGYNFTVYRHQYKNPRSIASDITRCVVIDEDNRVWIGTRDGLSLYNHRKSEFSNFYYKKREQNVAVMNIVPLQRDWLMLGTAEGILLFDVKGERFLNDTLSTALHMLRPSTLVRQGDCVYIGTEGGVYTYSLREGALKKLVELPAKVRIQGILCQMFNRVWIATEGGGLYMYDMKAKKLRNYRYEDKASGLNSNYVRSLALDQENRLWVGTYSGLNIYREGEDCFFSMESSMAQAGTLSQNSVRCIFRDSQGGMWLGTYWGGVNYYHPLCNRFLQIKHIPFSNSLSDNVVSCIVEDKKNNLWIGTSDGGLNFYDSTTKTYKNYLFNSDASEGVPFKDIKTVYVDEAADKVYVGAHAGGMMVLHRKTGRREFYNRRNSDLPSNNIYSIISDEGEGLWVASLEHLLYFDLVRKHFVVIDKDAKGRPIHKSNRLLFRDSKRRIWAGGEMGLSVYNQIDTALLTNTDFRITPVLEQSSVNCIYETSSGYIWVGTRDGLFALREGDKEPLQYTTDDGLLSNVIYGILEDSYGRLWVSTNQGLSCFNPDSRKFRNFTIVDGLQSNQFNAGSYCRIGNGHMLFGGINGITSFRPETLIDNPYTPKPVINKLFVFNKEVLPNDETGILKENIENVEHITLKSSQNSFSISFVVSNYIAGKHNTFAYKLEGYNKEWYRQGDISPVSYSNLPAGDYTFLLKAANNDGKWSKEVAALHIRVLPVWYCTWWALSLFALSFILFIFAVFRFFWLRKSMQTEIRMERLDKEKREEISQMKIRFYVNISHELRTPLTLIIAPLQELLGSVTGHWEREKLMYIQRNARRLLHLVNQLMDYRRAELGIFELKPSYANAYKRVLSNFLNYESLAKRKDIDYNFYSELQDEDVLFDGTYLDLIVNNLLSNAFKYTEEGESISVKLYKENKNVVLQVIDTGVGIPEDKQQKIFERFYQMENGHEGSGIGLSLVQRLVELHHGQITLASEVGRGSTFSIYIPQDKSAYSAEELVGSRGETEEQRVYSTNAHDVYVDDAEIVEVEAGEKEGSSRHGTILVVEDNDELRQYLSNGLSSQFNLIEAENGQKALELLKDRDVDLILSDVMMPVMDGVKLCKLVKQNLRTCHIPVYLLSAKVDIKYQLKGLQVGADDYIPKPFSIEVLIAKIQNMLRTRYRIFEHYSNTAEIEPEKITNNAMDEEVLKKAIAIVEKNISNVEFSTEQFASEMNMSRSNLHLKLKAITGKSAIDFIHKIRFNRACQLLKEGKYTVSEISFMVGYNTPSYFAARFKKYIGCLPTEYGKK
ncbi:two-component regulator propeller domain-containing protein [Bacteroides gallinarum]|uniref:two-component regulator propeller domain-containing protein n=1 Tax=Bacteroides gallinarum TaxID=376806 RepID=UPI00046A639D|nr:two-component regulator propeller domain-containing protein [Bacteroides gallinarum]